MNQSQHECAEHQNTICDGFTHVAVCTICNSTISQEPCPEAGSWQAVYDDSEDMEGYVRG